MEEFRESFKNEIIDYAKKNLKTIFNKNSNCYFEIKDNAIKLFNRSNKVSFIITVDDYISVTINKDKTIIPLFTCNHSILINYISELLSVVYFYIRTIGSEYDFTKRTDRNDCIVAYDHFKEMFITKNIVMSNVIGMDDYRYLDPSMCYVLTNYYNRYTGFVCIGEGIVYEYTIDISKGRNDLLDLVFGPNYEFNGCMNLSGCNDESLFVELLNNPFEFITDLVANTGPELFDLPEDSVVSFKRINQDYKELLKNIANNKQQKLNV